MPGSGRAVRGSAGNQPDITYVGPLEALKKTFEGKDTKLHDMELRVQRLEQELIESRLEVRSLKQKQSTVGDRGKTLLEVVGIASDSEDANRAAEDIASIKRGPGGPQKRKLDEVSTGTTAGSPSETPVRAVRRKLYRTDENGKRLSGRPKTKGLQKAPKAREEAAASGALPTTDRRGLSAEPSGLQGNDHGGVRGGPTPR